MLFRLAIVIGIDPPIVNSVLPQIEPDDLFVSKSQQYG